jgi:hypothetical protein
MSHTIYLTQNLAFSSCVWDKGIWEGTVHTSILLLNLSNSPPDGNYFVDSIVDNKALISGSKQKYKALPSGTLNLSTFETKWDRDYSDELTLNFLHFQSSFLHLQSSLLQNDKSEVKKHFIFPIYSYKNSIWGLTNDGNIIMSVGTDDMKAFQEIDYDKYYDKIFPAGLLFLLERVPINNLKDNITYEIRPLELNGWEYSLSVNFNSTERLLDIGYSTKEKKNTDDAGGVGHSYIFRLDENNQLIFKDVESPD